MQLLDAVCCSVLQRVAVCYSVLQCVAVCCSVLQCVAACCSVLQCVAVCCISSMLHPDLGEAQAFRCTPHEMHTRWDDTSWDTHAMRCTRDDMHTSWHAHAIKDCVISHICAWHDAGEGGGAEDASALAIKEFGLDESLVKMYQDEHSRLVKIFQDESLVKMYEDESLVKMNC